MEKNRRHRRGSDSGPSIDGMVRPGRNLGVPQSYRPSKFAPAPSLGEYSKKSDGFYPADATARGADRAEEEEANLLDEPIVLDHIQPKTRKQPKVKRHRIRKFLKYSAVSAAILVLVGGGYFAYKLYHTQKKVLAGGGRSVTVCNDNVDVDELKNEGDSRINILLLGIGGPGHDGANLTDTILLASIDPITDKTVLLSIPRDFWVKIPGDGYQKINAAYANAVDGSRAKTTTGQIQDGITQLDKTLEPIFDGVKIHYHVLLNFTAFKNTVDALGGVSVNVPETLYDPTIAWENHNNPTIAKQGIQTFNGDQALLYARSRETSSDFARGERQRLLITAIKQKAFSAGTFSNPVKVSSLLDTLGGNVFTDFSSSDIKCLYHQTATIPSSAITSLDMVTPPNALLTTGNMNGLSIVEPREGLFEYSNIHKFLHSALVDGLIAKEASHIEVYNATGSPGVATTNANTLKEYGYKVVKVDNTNSSSNPSKTVIVDLSKGKDKYTKNYLERRFGVIAVKKLPSELGITPGINTHFVIILGEDAATTSQN